MNTCSGNFYCLNGAFLPCSLFSETSLETGYSVYEVIRIVNGKALFLEDHLYRLSQSVTLSGHSCELNIERLTSDIKELIVKNNRRNGNIKIILNFISKDSIPSIYIFFITHYYPSVNQYLNGVDVTLMKFVRNDPNVKKIISYGSGKPEESKYYEALLVDEQDRITEGSRSNVFFITGRDIFTSPDDMVLKGITREKVINVIKALNINIIFESVSINDLNKTDAVFLTGTSPKVLPVKRIDDMVFNVENEILNTIMKSYNTLVNNYLCNLL